MDPETNQREDSGKPPKQKIKKNVQETTVTTRDILSFLSNDGPRPRRKEPSPDIINID